MLHITIIWTLFLSFQMVWHMYTPLFDILTYLTYRTEACSSSKHAGLFSVWLACTGHQIGFCVVWIRFFFFVFNTDSLSRKMLFYLVFNNMNVKFLLLFFLSFISTSSLNISVFSKLISFAKSQRSTAIFFSKSSFYIKKCFFLRHCARPPSN